MKIISEKQSFDFRIEAGDDRTSWTSIVREQATRFMTLHISSGGDPGAKLTFATRKLRTTGDGGLAKLGTSTANNFEIQITGAGGSILTSALSPLAGLVGRDWQIRSDTVLTNDLELVLEIS